jgi:hypothetical protein
LYYNTYIIILLVFSDFVKKGLYSIILYRASLFPGTALAIASVRSASPARHNYILYFTKNIYIHMYNLYSIFKTLEHDILLVRQFHLVSPVLLLSRHELKPHLLQHSLTFYADLTKWPKGLTGQPGSQAGVPCLGQSCGPGALGLAGLCQAVYLAIYMRRCGL